MFNNLSERRKWELTIFFSMYVMYAAFMVCRNTMIAVSPAMLADPTIDLDKATYGQLASYATMGAMAGKLFLGPLADKIGGRKTFLLTLGATSATTYAFGWSSAFVAFLLFNFFGQFFKAGGWPAMAKVIGAWYPEDRQGKVWGAISTSSRLGTMAASFGFGYLLLYTTWRTVFMVSGTVGVLALGVGFMLLKNSPEDIGLKPTWALGPDEGGPAEAAKAPPPHFLDDKTLTGACFVFVKSARVWLICLAIMALTILMDFLTFLPLYLNETMKIEAGKAAMASTVFPAGMFVSVLGAGFIYDRLSKAGILGFLAGMLGLATASVLVLWQLPHFGLEPDAAFPLAIGAIFIFGLGIAPSYYIPMSIFSVQFGGKHSGFLVALIDIFGYLASTIFTYFGGSTIQARGWPFFLKGLLGVTVTALALMAFFLFLDYKASLKSRKAE